ncbi:thiol-disulfide isomerase/thioredoxin [Prauserella shujinwangii]|uniref:Thiol-disulfide isomerase/thioredoxin n=1 Tax=Prauserella shujinwangii TaxID=1453103 RepID=A0A2T0LUA8_9PSEU|nr:thioredoxin family protein [Prauserella shujinwangii]PRX47425.1 thiol-disulfide isomerase/thioredoxin [Prauserella shujinwangii]
MTGVWVLVGTLVAGLLAGALLARRNGRIRAAGPARAEHALPAPVAAVLDTSATGPAVTLVQLSTTFCAPCRHARAVLGQLAERTDGLRHVELDVTHQPQVAQQLGVLRTPTTLALGPEGDELLRVSGVPKAPELLAALEAHLTRARPTD